MENKVTLYSLTEEMRSLLENVDPETGELPDGYGEVHALVEKKASAVAAYIANKELELQAIDDRLAIVANNVRKQRARTTWLRQYLLEAMQKTGITEIKSSDGMLSVRRLVNRDMRVIIDEQSADKIPEKYKRTYVREEYKKKEIREDILNGEEVPGARLEAFDRLELR